MGYSAVSGYKINGEIKMWETLLGCFAGVILTKLILFTDDAASAIKWSAVLWFVVKAYESLGR